MSEAIMNRNTPVLDAGTLATAEPALDAVPFRAWRLVFIGQLWMLAAFAGLSLVVIAAVSAFHGGAGHGKATLLATAVAGALLVALGWRGVARILRRVEHDAPHDPEPGARQTPHRGPGASPARAGVAAA